MNLRTRIIVFAGWTFSCLIAGIYFFSAGLLIDSYSDLEIKDARKNLDRASLAFYQLAADLHVRAVDWRNGMTLISLCLTIIKPS